MSFGGAVLQDSVTTSLSGFGWANRTSSYRIGGCNATLKSGSATYPGITAANVSSGSMLAGWDNTITNVIV